MPYITEDRKQALDRILVDQEAAEIKSYGELNYLYTKLMLAFVDQNGLSYSNIHTIKYSINCYRHGHDLTPLSKEFRVIALKFLGVTDEGLLSCSEHLTTALELAFLEFYRRVGSKYEDKKILENGDVYNLDDYGL